MLGGPIDAQTLPSRRRGQPAWTVLPAMPLAPRWAPSGRLRDTPILIRSSGGDDAGFAVVAGRSKDSRLVQILISNYQIAPKYLGGPRDNWDTTLPERRTLEYRDNGGYDATITLPAPGKYQVKRYRISRFVQLCAGGSAHRNGPEHPPAGRAAAARESNSSPNQTPK